jgi:hypothetical protein
MISPKEEETILVMLSGGVDSTYLLYHYLRHTSHPVHAHHNSPTKSPTSSRNTSRAGPWRSTLPPPVPSPSPKSVESSQRWRPAWRPRTKKA